MTTTATPDTPQSATEDERADDRACASTSRSSRSSATPAREPRPRVRPSAPSAPRWATACGRSRSSRPRSSRPPARAPAPPASACASARRPITNVGDEADLVVAFNEQVLYGRIEQGAYKAGTVVLLENKWRDDTQEEIREQYAAALADFARSRLGAIELASRRPAARSPTTRAWARTCSSSACSAGSTVATSTRRSTRRPRLRPQGRGGGGEEPPPGRGRLGLRRPRAHRRGPARASEVPPRRISASMVVMNGNQALGLGVMAAGIETVAMYPITPATSVSHYLAGALPRVGGIVHQAEDEIAAIGFAIGASYAGKTACTITSGPGLALKTEMLGLAVMAEVPLVLLLVQRGGPSTGLPTKVEQGDLMAVLHGTPGDAPKIVLAPATIEECFHFVVLARKLAEDFRGPVMVLTDANLATGVQPFPRPQPQADWLAAAARPVAVAGGARALRLGPGDRPVAAPGARPPRRRVHAHRPRPHAQSRRSPTTRPRTRTAARRAAASWRRCRRRWCRRRSTATTRATCWWSAGARPSAPSRRRSTGCARRGTRSRRSTCASCRRSSRGWGRSSTASAR